MRRTAPEYRTRRTRKGRIRCKTIERVWCHVLRTNSLCMARISHDKKNVNGHGRTKNAKKHQIGGKPSTKRRAKLGTRKQVIDVSDDGENEGGRHGGGKGKGRGSEDVCMHPGRHPFTVHPYGLTA